MGEDFLKENGYDLYKLSVEEEHYFLTAHQDRINFFLGILSALVGGSIAGIFKSTEWYHYALTMIGPIMILIVSSIASKGVARLYRRFLEAITMRSKIERHFGLMDERQERKTGYWIDYEPIIPKRHVDSSIDREKKYKDSDKWVNIHMDNKESYHGVILCLFNSSKMFGWILLGSVIALVFVKLII